MARKIDPASERVLACQAAARKLVAKYGSAKKAEAGTGLTQQTLSALIKRGKLGIDFADQLAAHYETTIDGLVWLFVHEGDGAVIAGNIPGWQRAVEEARSQWGDSAYEVAAHTHLPTAPRHASARFAYDLAQVFHMHVKSSSVRPAVRKVGG